MTQFIQRKNTEATQLDDEWIVLDTDNFTITMLNEMGGYCWSLLEKQQSVHTLSEAIQAEFKIDEKDDVRKDIENFIHEMIKCDLVSHVH